MQRQVAGGYVNSQLEFDNDVAWICLLVFIAGEVYSLAFSDEHTPEFNWEQDFLLRHYGQH